MMPLDNLLHPWTGQEVVIMSDGSHADNVIGWAALVADGSKILATTSGSFQAIGGHSTASEWLGRYAAITLLSRAGIPPRAVRWSLVDNQSATMALGGNRRSGCPWLDDVRLAVASFLRQSRCEEAYVPSVRLLRAYSNLPYAQRITLLSVLSP